MWRPCGDVRTTETLDDTINADAGYPRSYPYDAEHSHTDFATSLPSYPPIRVHGARHQPSGPPAGHRHRGQGGGCADGWRSGRAVLLRLLAAARSRCAPATSRARYANTRCGTWPGRPRQWEELQKTGCPDFMLASQYVQAFMHDRVLPHLPRSLAALVGDHARTPQPLHAVGLLVPQLRAAPIHRAAQRTQTSGADAHAPPPSLPPARAGGRGRAGSAGAHAQQLGRRRAA